MSKRKLPQPSAGAGDGLVEFREALQQLKNKSSKSIGNLTALAEGQYASCAEVVQAITEEMAIAPVARLQSLVSVVDSILKKIGKDYKAHLADCLPAVMRSAVDKSDANMKGWLQKMVTESWRKHELLPDRCLVQLERIWEPASAPAVKAAAAPQPAPAKPPVPHSSSALGQAAQAAPQPTAAAPGAGPPGETAPPPAAKAAPRPGGSDELLRAGPAPPMKAPPPKKPPPSGQAAAAAPPPSIAEWAPELVKRRLTILTKIIERKQPETKELHEIMKVPEIKKAISMQTRGNRQEAMALLSEFKQELERKHDEFMQAATDKADPRMAAAPGQPGQAATSRPADPRQQQAAPAARPADPRQPDPRQPPRPADPRQPAAAAAAASAVDPRRRGQAAAAAEAGIAADAPAAGKRGAVDSSAPPPLPKQQRVDGGAAGAAQAAEAAGAAEAEGGPESELAQAPARQVLQGLPSIGFSETWLRQFLEQMPAKAPPPELAAQFPLVGRKVLSAAGEQMVYVDELSPNESLLLMQLIFLLEERLRRSGGSLDVAQRIPHTFSYLQVEHMIDVMLKRFFDEVPFQCDKTGLRFTTREKLRKHQDVINRRKQMQQHKQRGAEARGWMEPIPEWVGNRDLVVGPALFRLGGAGEDGSAATAEKGLPGGGGASDAEDNEDEQRWICPLDERRSVCPISGELFQRTWSTALNDWAFTDVIAVELNSSQPLRFPGGARQRGAKAQPGLSETAVLFKKSCFYNTPPQKRLQALEECRYISARRPGLGPGTATARSVPKGGTSAISTDPKDPALAALAKVQSDSKPFF